MKKNQKGFAAVSFAVAFLVIVLLIGATGTLVYKIRQDSSKRSTPLMIVTSSGGLCAGKCNDPVYKLYDDGKFTGGRYKNLSDSETAKLKNIIQVTDFLKYAPNPHPQCQSFMDGSDQVLLFPQKYDNKTFTPCMMDIRPDDPAFAYIDKLLDEHYIQPD